ncbi:aldo/keto reductase [bacterium]|nr:aldo/keto reductase [candidate division CSSED10-310 bacterium]
MRTRRLGWTGLELSVIGLGTWAMGGGDWAYGWGPQDEADSIATIKRAMALGINWIDTAAAYGLGRSEEVIGRTLKGMSEPPVIATKCGLLWNDDGSVYGYLKPESIRREAEESLRRLGVERIDLYQIHWPNPPEDIEGAWEMLLRLVDEGKIRYPAVCNFPVAYLERIRRLDPPASLQPPYSMLQRDTEFDLLPYCATHHMGVVAYSPMARGMLTGAMTAKRLAILPESDHRRNDRRFRQPMLGIDLALIEDLKPIARDNGMSLAQLALAWVLRRPEVTSAITGARRPEQIEETAAAGGIELPDDAARTIDELLAERERRMAAAIEDYSPRT